MCVCVCVCVCVCGGPGYKAWSDLDSRKCILPSLQRIRGTQVEDRKIGEQGV